MSITYELILIAVLILINGLLVMAEFAIVAAKKSRLLHKAEQGDKDAADALSLAEEPTNFLSTIQIGITLISIVIGAFGGATTAESLNLIIQGFPPLAPYSEALALATVVLVVTYFTLLFGEIVPKWIGMNDAERIASTGGKAGTPALPGNVPGGSIPELFNRSGFTGIPPQKRYRAGNN